MFICGLESLEFIGDMGLMVWGLVEISVLSGFGRV